MDTWTIDKVWLTDSEIWIRTAEGKEASEKISDYPRLEQATPEQRMNYVLSRDGIHWLELDEDLCFEGFFRKRETSCTSEK